MTLGDLKRRLNDIREENLELSKNIEELNPQANVDVTSVPSDSQITQQFAQTTVKACDWHIKTKLEQLQMGNETIEMRMKEEVSRRKQSYYDYLTKDEVALKPYHEVEAATEDLKQLKINVQEECKTIKEQSSHLYRNLREQYREFIENIKVLEILTNELRLEESNGHSYLTDKVFTANVNFEDDGNVDESAIQHLQNEIKDLETELAHYSEDK
ncbi:uncharacterized protein LOC106086509 isoform X2 [Stomoxys calcitrans]|nr:uncharacterized protein LOC106086509 isoform X2 [Stomoxys calcitrans]